MPWDQPPGPTPSALPTWSIPASPTNRTSYPSCCFASFPRPLASSVAAIAGCKQAFQSPRQLLAFGWREEAPHLHLPPAGYQSDRLVPGDQAHPVRVCAERRGLAVCEGDFHAVGPYPDLFPAFAAAPGTAQRGGHKEAVQQREERGEDVSGKPTQASREPHRTRQCGEQQDELPG